MNPRAINGTPFADVPAGYRIIVVERSGWVAPGYRWQRIADGYVGLTYPTHQRAVAGAVADHYHRVTGETVL